MHCASLKRGKNFFISDLKCSVCGMTMPIPRTKLMRKSGHVKHLFCIKCGEITAHTETREFDFNQITS